ncbi:MAG TPA: nicotinate-nucleotide adenylyltransferase [Pyrinomonadaceae bacterium]|jgi:nicotinate-nucleotide adenylyltransferase|nr:nicotinate-nucleotide adenylyltransferase [Pyrinomonadaceae bacterium]
MTAIPADNTSTRKKLAFFGGSFDPVHLGHLSTARRLTELFRFDELNFVPACHAPHKRRKTPTPALDRFAMLCLATESERHLRVSKMEVEQPEKPYTYQTLSRLNERYPNDDIYFIMGADSWADITTWYKWEKVLRLSNHVVMTRPGYPIETGHVTDDIRGRIVDVRGKDPIGTQDDEPRRIYFSDAVSLDISASSIRLRIAQGDPSWKRDVPESVVNYIEKYKIYR